jgi:hypothetical protein
MYRIYSETPFCKLLLGFIFFIALPMKKSFSQTTTFHRYLVEFTDKENSPYSISSPSAYLSQRAIDRRNRYGIPITEADLPVNPSYVQAVQATGVTLLNRSKWLNSISIYTEDSLALVAIRNLPFVKSSNPIAYRPKGSTNVYDQKWNEDFNVSAQQKLETYSSADYGNAFHQISMLHGDNLQQTGFVGDGMIIAILDGGFYNVPLLDVFDSLYASNRVLGVWSFVNENEDVYTFSTHGTEVLSLIGANKPE